MSLVWLPKSLVELFWINDSELKKISQNSQQASLFAEKDLKNHEMQAPK